MAKRLFIEEDHHVEDLRKADGSMVRIKGEVWVKFKCRRYRGIAFASVFVELNKQMILGIPWFSKGRAPHWLSSNHNGGETRLKSDIITIDQSPTIGGLITSYQFTQCYRGHPYMLQSNQMEGGFLWIIRLVEEESWPWKQKGIPKLHWRQSGIRGFLNQLVRSLRNVMMFIFLPPFPKMRCELL